MKNQIAFANFHALQDHETSKIKGGCLFMLAVCVTVDVVIGLAIYGAFMDGYSDGKAAAGG